MACLLFFKMISYGENLSGFINLVIFDTKRDIYEWRQKWQKKVFRQKNSIRK